MMVVEASSIVDQICVAQRLSRLSLSPTISEVFKNPHGIATSDVKLNKRARLSSKWSVAPYTKNTHLPAEPQGLTLKS
jgi:hypothetical protein